MTSDQLIAPLEAYLHALHWLLPLAALFDAVCWLVIWAVWRKMSRNKRV